MSNFETEVWNTAGRELNRSTTLTDNEAERLLLAAERIAEIPGEDRVPGAFRDFFSRTAAFLTDAYRIMKAVGNGSNENLSLAELQEQNRRIYADILPENYAASFGNPTYAVEKLGKEFGDLLGTLYMELRGAVVYAYEDKKWDMLVTLELFLEIYFLFCDAATEDPRWLPKPKAVREALYWYVSDYSMEMMDQRTRETLDPNCSFARDIIVGEDLTDLRYLYRFGEYITDSELKMAEFLNSRTDSEIEAIAKTWTEGYRMGFVAQKKDLSIKKTVNIRYRLGMERVVRAAIWQFEDMGLESVIYRSATHAVSKRQHLRIGYYGALPNPQFEYDHRNDAELWTDEKFVTRKLQTLRCAYEHYKSLAKVHAGPAVMEVFGEVPFVPQANPDALSMSEEAQKESLRYANEAGQITNRYIIGEERSFNIIAYPVPAIGDKFEEIFKATEKINNLDYMKYQRIQQIIIDALDQGEEVHIGGMNGNCTDLTVHLHHLDMPESQTNFENCVADVNIPVGEVFTSPLLAKTSGILNVRRVYLGEFQYIDLKIKVEDGMTADYSCANFETEEENRRYIEENILYHHKSIPMGEFAIGTNTTAYRMAKDFGIHDKLPILIAEKMGPHFAFGDTCYSWQEEMAVYNPDGKEIIARDNERSLLRKTDVSKAYFGCHTDITIPYEELGHIRVLTREGSWLSIIEDGRFVLPGTEELNLPLDEH